VIALTNAHDNAPSGVIGSVTKAQDMPYGLKLRFKYSSAPDAQAIRTKAKEGHIGGLSIFGPIISHAYENRAGRDLRIITEAGLWAVGLTPMPVNTKALVTSAKAKGRAGGRDEDLSEVWICDMKSALAITVPAARKAAVDLLVKSQYNIGVVDRPAPAATTNDGGGTAAPTAAPSTTTEPVTGVDDASTYALNLIGEPGPDGKSPGGESGSGSLADQLLATLGAATTSADIEALAAEIGMP
jgi:HK97 family phage prohead protease